MNQKREVQRLLQTPSLARDNTFRDLPLNFFISYESPIPYLFIIHLKYIQLNFNLHVCKVLVIMDVSLFLGSFSK